MPNRKTLLTGVCGLLLFFLVAAFPQYDEETILMKSNGNSWNLDNSSIVSISPPNYIPKAIGHYTKADWQTVIDSTWGSGYDSTTELSYFEEMWQKIDEEFACFHRLPVGIWDSVWNRYHPELETSDVSKGRFSAIFSHALRHLSEVHSSGGDLVIAQTALLPGVPIMIAGAWGDCGHFGAGLTPLGDSTLLVYKTVESHPLGLEPGDLVLGYEGVPWAELVRELIDYELPMLGWPYYRGVGTCPSAYDHTLLMGAGMNWHLFDSIDVVKYDSGDTLRLSVQPLEGQSMSLWCSEQIEYPGISIPDTIEAVSYGKLDGTDIGIIYVATWSPRLYVRNKFYTACAVMLSDTTLDGLIIDFRSNTGGYPAGDLGFKLLFDSAVQTIRKDERCDPVDHYTLCRYTYTDYDIPGDVGTHFDKPIAMLTGPGAWSAGDYNGANLAHHPLVKAFGKPLSGTFNGKSVYNMGNLVYGCSDNNVSMAWDSGHYYSHAEFPGPEFPWLDYEYVWLTPENVAQGKDDVVEAAITWILSRDIDQDGFLNENDNCPEIVNYDQSDIDSDGVGDSCDNCIDIYNPDQADTDENDVGDVCQFVCADINNDDLVNIFDITFLISYLYKDGPAPESMWASDANGDGTVNIFDVTYVISFLYKGGPVPECP